MREDTTVKRRPIPIADARWFFTLAEWEKLASDIVRHPDDWDLDALALGLMAMAETLADDRAT